MWKGSRRGGGGGGAGGGGRGRGPASPNDIQRQRVAATLIDAAARHGLQVTDVGFGRFPPQMQFLQACNDGDLDRLKGVTPLHCAVSDGKVRAVRYLLEKGADPNIKDSSNGTTSLHEAVALGYDEITRLLLANGANVDEPSSHGTPLVAAAAHGKFSSMKILLEHHADPNKVSWEFGTPLTTTLYATPDRMDESTCLKCMKLLVEAGADVKCTNPQTPLAIATTNGLARCVEYLLEVKTSENGSKAQLKSNGAKAVERKDYTAASKFYSELHHHSNKNCPSAPRNSIIILALLVLIMMGWTVASASTSPTCEVTSLATNIRLYCTANQPSSSCCDSLRAAAMSYGRHRCLCLVGSSPDVIMIGYSAENLVRLYAQCTEDDEFGCEGAVGEDEEPMRQDDSEDAGYEKVESQEEVIDEGDRGERMPRHGRRHDDGRDNDEPQEVTDQREHWQPEGQIHGYEDETEEAMDQQKEIGHLRKKQGEAGSTRDQRFHYEYQPSSHNGPIIAIIAIIAGLLVLALCLLGGVAVYKHHHRLNIRQLVHLVAAAALPALARQARLAAVNDLPPQQPPPATTEVPASVNGVPVAQGPPLAFFPGPVEVVSLVLYIVIDKMRRSLGA